jgi:ssDNA-binding Zn-finger/Zn-ribbon topoisomerase 1
MIDPLQRANTEKSLQQIAMGSVDSGDFLRNSLIDLEKKFDTLVQNKEIFMENFRETYNKFSSLEGKTLENNAGEVPDAQGNIRPRGPNVDLSKCPKCKSGVLRALSSKKHEYFIGCSVRDCTLYFFDFKVGKVRQLEDKCEACQATKLELTKIKDSTIHYCCTSPDCIHSFMAILAPTRLLHEDKTRKAATSKGDSRKTTGARATIPRVMEGSKAPKSTSQKMNLKANQNNAGAAANQLATHSDSGQEFHSNSDPNSDEETVKENTATNPAAVKGRLRQKEGLKNPDRPFTKQTTQKRIICYKCQKPGHIAPYCPG